MPDIDKILQHLNEQDKDIYSEIFTLNVYAANRAEIENRIVIDVGANIGIFSIFAAINGAKQIYSIEPDRVNYRRLLDNIEEFTNIVPLHAAMCKPGIKNISLISCGVNCQVVESDNGKMTTCTSLIDFVKDIPGNDLLLKLDCEGSEYDIVETSPPDILRKFKYIYAEIHDATIFSLNKENNADKVIDYLKLIGFDYQRLDHVSFGVWYTDSDGNLTNFVPSTNPPARCFKFTRKD